MSKTKLSPRQQRVIDLMTEGWELGKPVTFNGRTWLQRDGVGRGGQTEDVHKATFINLYRRGLIKLAKNGFPTQRWKLVIPPDGDSPASNESLTPAP